METKRLKPKAKLKKDDSQRRTQNGSRSSRPDVEHCAARESERRPHAKKNLGEERMAQSSKSQDQKCQRVVENPIARGRNLAGNGAHSWQAEMLSGKRNSLPQTSIGGKSQPAEKRSRNA
jgi:hypothetical protein